jgi:multicomponent Na+:H+ antiporter subunit A
VPLNGWMPLAYAAAPIPAAAALSGGAVKAGVIGLIRFLPLGAALSGWGEALAWAGFISAFYGVAIGLTQRDPKTVLAYSSISQMGVIAAGLGLALAGADQGAASDVAFYAANHVLVKAALFLTVGVAATVGGRRLWLGALVAAALALSLGGLPLTGGALAKLAVKGTFGDGAAGAMAATSAAATTALMLHFLVCLARSQSGRAEAAGERVWPWLALAAASMLVSWLMFPIVGGDFADAVAPGTLWDALWPMLIGAALFAGLWALGEPLPRIPAGDILVPQEAAFRASAPLAALTERLDWRLRQWPAAGMSLLTIALVLAAAGFASR